MSRFAAPTNELKKHTRSRYKQAETIVIYRQPTEQKSSQALQHILKDNTACLTEGFCACWIYSSLSVYLQRFLLVAFGVGILHNTRVHLIYV